MDARYALALSLTVLAGLSTGIGSLIAFVVRRTNQNLLSLGLGFSAGVMIYVSFVEMLSTARSDLGRHFGSGAGDWLAVGGFFGGMLFIGAIDRLVPSYENPHDAKNPTALSGPPEHALDGCGDMARETAATRSAGPAPTEHQQRLLRMGVLTALAIGIHNFPEGLATLVATLQEPKSGLSVAVAIAIHNIPEGIAIAVPLYFSTGSRRKAFTYSFLSGLAEPVGAVVGYALLATVLPPSAMGIVFASVAGIMVFISLDQLIPNAHEYGKGHMPIYGLVGGMALMALTLLLM